MNMRMIIKEKFELSNGTTVLACSGYNSESNVIGKRVRLVSGDEVRQVLTISGEQIMLHQKASLDQKAFETRDVVLLSSEEARSGDWFLTDD